MSAYGIISYGAHIPRKRISRQAIFDSIGWAQPSLKSLAKGARAFASWDEDAITMSVESARRCLAGVKDIPTSLCFASTTAPFLDRQNAGVVAAALDLAVDTHCYDLAGSQRAGLSALIAAGKDRKSNALVVASDNRPVKPASPMEMLSGDAGAAFLLGENNIIAEIAGVHTIYADIVDHYRTAESEFDYMLEERWFREAGLARHAPAAVQPLLESHNVKPGDISHLIAPTANPHLARAVAAAAGVEENAIADSLFEGCGHAGAAHPLLMLANVLDIAKPGEWILVTAFGQGCDAVLLRATGGIDDAQCRGSFASGMEDKIIEDNYTKFLSAAGNLDISWGMRAERDNRTAQTVAFAKSRDLYGFVGGLCEACDTPQFPKSRRCVNPDCAELDTQTDYRFADRRAKVKTFTEDWLAFTREPPLIYGNISFEGGGNVFMEMTGFNTGEVTVGAPVQMNFRIKDKDPSRGFHRYFWKAALIPGGAHG